MDEVVDNPIAPSPEDLEGHAFRAFEDGDYLSACLTYEDAAAARKASGEFYKAGDDYYKLGLAYVKASQPENAQGAWLNSFTAYDEHLRNLIIDYEQQPWAKGTIYDNDELERYWAFSRCLNNLFDSGYSLIDLHNQLKNKKAAKDIAEWLLSDISVSEKVSTQITTELTRPGGTNATQIEEIKHITSIDLAKT